jgi:hypothetical protein
MPIGNAAPPKPLPPKMKAPAKDRRCQGADDREIEIMNTTAITITYRDKPFLQLDRDSA